MNIELCKMIFIWTDMKCWFWSCDSGVIGVADIILFLLHLKSVHQLIYYFVFKSKKIVLSTSCLPSPWNNDLQHDNTEITDIVTRDKRFYVFMMCVWFNIKLHTLQKILIKKELNSPLSKIKVRPVCTVDVTEKWCQNLYQNKPTLRVCIHYMCVCQRRYTA